MFYCETCADKRGWPTDFYLPQSRGGCELCHVVGVCFDVPSSRLRSTKPKEESMPKEEKYFVITCDSNGPHIKEYTLKEMRKELGEDDGAAIMGNEEAPVEGELPDGKSWDLMEGGATVIIRGRIVVPQPKEVVTKYEVE